MALIKCKECGKEYSENANNCPNCGNPTNIDNVNNNKGKKKTNNQAISALLSIIIFIGLFAFIYTKIGSLFESNVDGSKYDTDKIYSIGDTLTCPNWEVKVDNVKIKRKGEAIDSYFEVSDPEWIGVTLSIKNISSETKTFYNSNVKLTNSNGEVIDNSVLVYSIWGSEKLGSPELTSGGSKTGFIQYSNTEQDNSNLILSIDCNNGLFDDKVVYKVNVSQ